MNIVHSYIKSTDYAPTDCLCTPIVPCKAVPSHVKHPVSDFPFFLAAQPFPLKPVHASPHLFLPASFPGKIFPLYLFHIFHVLHARPTPSQSPHSAIHSSLQPVRRFHQSVPYSLHTPSIFTHHSHEKASHHSHHHIETFFQTEFIFPVEIFFQ